MVETLFEYSSVKHLIAYFSMEIAIDAKIPTYSGGLGVLAGDSIKAFADLNLDVVAVTLLIEKGYLTQKLDSSNYQQESDVIWEKEKYLKKIDATISVRIKDREVFVTAWEHIIVGEMGKPLRIIYLDTNLEENNEKDRLLTSHLYGGDDDYRLEQEIVLGIGGLKILRELNYSPKKYHMNEGHAGFLTLQLMNELKKFLPSYEERSHLVREMCSFTTHTPVAAGHDAFDENKVRYALGELFPNEIARRVCVDGKFSMTLLALELSSYKNAVARKHRDVTLKMFPNFTIDYITNGVHSVTWTNDEIAELLDKYVVDWRKNSLELRNAHKIPTAELSKAHKLCKQELFDYIKQTTNIQLNPDIFTIGFARRATQYKRPNLLFRDFERLKYIANNKGKMQIIFAGKAHPRDTEGKLIIQQIANMSKYSYDNLRIIFLENYDMDLAKKLVSGVDVWLNTPKRPLEASGTSGMKAAHNGVPSLSILDGWWCEGCIEGITGWAIGEEFVDGSDNYIDDKDAQSLYEKLEQTILPMFYNDYNSFLVIMRNSIAINGSFFNTHRMANQYIVRAYVRKDNLQ
jgi:glycogen phosphorylase